MHNLKQIRDNPKLFKKKILERNVDLDFEELLDLDKKNREIIQKKEKLEQEKKIISKNKDKTQFSKSKKISQEIDKINKDQLKIQVELESILSGLPNIALDDVPVGKDEKSNKEVKKVGETSKLDFKPLSHYEIGKRLNLMDFDTATKTSGSRFVFIKGKLAKLERAISNFGSWPVPNIVLSLTINGGDIS